MLDPMRGIMRYFVALLLLLAVAFSTTPSYSHGGDDCPAGSKDPDCK
jgi:hypothetical protein